MPPQLNDELAKLSQAFATLKQRLDKDSIKALGEQVFSVRQLLREILSSLDVLKNDNELSDPKLTTWEKLGSEAKLDRLRKVAEKVVIEESTELATFFTNISNSVINAQKQLNEFSKEYISDLEKDNSPVPPTYFAIPSLKAEMKLGVSEMTSKGVNVILFKSEQQKERFFESAVTFELVSTPPAPATRPQPEAPPQPMLAPPSPPTRALAAAREEERTRLDELTVDLEEARAAMLAVTESLLEVVPPKKPETARKRSSKTKKAPAKKSRSKKPTKK